MNRYAGKPFLRLLECYVLHSIGYLEESQQSVLQKMEPKLRETYSASGSWIEIVAKQMEFPNSFPDQIKSIWSGYERHVRQQGIAPNPNQFAAQFVDENFQIN